MRGGTANCTVVISDELIGSPIVANPDILIVMNDASLEKFQPRLKEKGLLVFDSSLIKDHTFRSDIEALGVPATEISAHLGNTKSANMVLLGALVEKTRLVEKTSLSEALESLVPERRRKSIDVNKKAILEGIRFIEDKKSQDI